MSTITVIGGTGYAGAAIVAEAASRGHSVTSLSRSELDAPVEGVRYVFGSALEPAVLADATESADVIVSAVAARGDMADVFADLTKALADKAEAAGATLVAIGGFSSLRPAPGAPRFIEGEISEQYVVEARAGHAFLTMLQESGPQLDYVFVSPAAKFGSWVPGEAHGHYTLGGDVAILDEDGSSYLHADDLALAVLDVIENDDIRREHISVVS